MRVFLAGGTGVVGRRIVPLLRAEGHQVSVMTRDAGRARSLGGTPVVVDAYDTAALTDAVGAARPDVIMHQLTDLREGPGPANARLRELGTRNLVAAARTAGVRRIIAQSIAWVYEPGTAPAAEDTPLDLAAEPPRQGSVRGVVALEEAVRELPEWVVLRYGLFYGPGTWYAADGRFGRAARDGLLTAGPDIDSFVHVDDAARAAVAALGWPAGTVNICDDEPAAGHQWVPAFCTAVGAPPPPRRDGPRQPWARGATNHRARKELAWEPEHPSWRPGFQT